MVRQWSLVLAIVVLLVAPISTNACITFWALGTPTEFDNADAELRARLGLNMEDEAQVGEMDVGVPEFGLQVDWIGRESDFSRLGIYGLLHMRTEAEAATWAGRPYMGASVDLAVAGNKDKASSYGPIIGTRYAKILVFEYQYRFFDGPLKEVMDQSSDKHVAYAGLCLRW